MTVLSDSSGNGNNGTYNPLSLTTFGVTGLVGSDHAVSSGPGGTGANIATVPVSPGLLAGDCWASYWMSPGYTGVGGYGNWTALFFQATTAPLSAVFTLGDNWNSGGTTLGLSVTRMWGPNVPDEESFNSASVAVTPGDPHMLAVVYDSGADEYRCYIDGVLIDTVAGSGHPGATYDPDTFTFGFDLQDATTYDEIAYGTGAPSDADIANLYALRNSFPGYSGAIGALSPAGYYHLDDGGDVNAFPTLFVEIGFDIPTGYPYLVLNDATAGKFNTGQFAPDFTWTDVTDDVRSLQITRGRQRQIEAFAAGTCAFELDNNAGDYDPDNPAGAYYGTTNSVLPMRPVRVRAFWNGTEYPLFYGYLDVISPQYAQGEFSDAWVSMTATDGMKVLQNILSEGVAVQEATGTRITRLLDNAGWPSALRDIAVGDVQLQATTLAATVAQDIQTSVDSEYGRWYFGPDGHLVFENRSSRTSSQALAASWTDADTDGLLYSQISRIMDDDLIRNVVTIQNVGGEAQTVSDTASIAQYQERSFSATNLLLTTDNDAYQLASVYLYNGKQLAGCRFDGVEFQPVTSIPAGGPDDLWPEVLGRQISDRVAVEITPPNVAPFSVGVFVEGVAHDITTSPQNWVTRFHASRANPTPFLEFNDATLGTFNSNVFGY